MSKQQNSHLWSETDRAIVRTHYPLGGSFAVQRHLSVPRSIGSIHYQAQQMHLCAPERWTPEQDAVIVRFYTSQGGKFVAEQTGRSVLAVARRAAKLKIPADRSRAAAVRWEKQDRKPNPPKPRKVNKPLTVMRERDKQTKAVMLRGEADMSRAKVTIAPPFVDRRFVPDGPVRRVVDSSQCRAWAVSI
jgi:hypothetical protein